MAFSSRVEYTGSTSTGPYSFSSIALFNDAVVPLQSQVIVTITGAVQTFTSGSPGAGQYSMDKTLRTIQLGSAPASGDTIRIRRYTSSTAYVDFTNNSPLTAADLDTATQQALFLAEEGVEAIESGDAVLALPELTDVDPTMDPIDGNFLRWNESRSRWEAQNFSIDGTGPDVNIVTSFPTSPTAGDMIYHSRFGQTYIYTGTEWSPICGTGDYVPAPAGTVITELTFGAAGRLDALPTTAGWVPLTLAASPSITSETGNTGGFATPNPSSGSSAWDWADAGGTSGCDYDFRKCWFATGVGNSTGALTFNNATFNSECTTYFPNANDGSTVWWGGASESNSALNANAVLMPRYSKAVMDPDTGFTGGSSNNYQAILWYYPAAVDWANTSWRVTTKMLQVRPGYNGNIYDCWGGMSFLHKRSPWFDRTPTDLNVRSTNDVNGLVAAYGSDYADIQDDLGGIFHVGWGPPSSSTTIATTALVPGPQIMPTSMNTFWSETSGSSSSPQVATSSCFTELFAQLQTTATSYTQNAANGNVGISDKAIVYVWTAEWDAAAKVLTAQVKAESSTPYNEGGKGAGAGLTMQTNPANGNLVKALLERASGDFFFGHGSSGNSYSGYSTGNAPPGLISIKIETL